MYIRTSVSNMGQEGRNRQMSAILNSILATIASLLSTTQVNRDFLKFNKKRLNIHKTRIDGAWEETAKNREFLRHNKKRLNIHAAKIAELETTGGVKGDKGDQGFTGRPGVDGLDGQNGNDGTDGAPGAKGDKGDAGNNGAPGLDGTNGQDGRDGADGAAGAGRWGLYKNGTKLGSILPVSVGGRLHVVSSQGYVVSLGQTYASSGPEWSLLSYKQNVTQVDGEWVVTYTSNIAAPLPIYYETTDCSDDPILLTRETFGYKGVTLINRQDGSHSLMMVTDTLLTEQKLDDIGSKGYYSPDGSFSCYSFVEAERNSFIWQMDNNIKILIGVLNDPTVSGFDNEIIDVPHSESEIK